MTRMYLAAAGSGKTTFLLQTASNRNKRYLYTTFTDENAEVAKGMLIEKHGCVPSNVTILPWFSFLLEHGVRPFQGVGGFGGVQFNGVDLSREGIRYNKRPALGYFCNSSNLIYASKLPELALHCNKCSGNAVFNRLQRLFDVVLIDEAQDMAGYDFEFRACLMDSGIDVIICGDERQSTYRTNSSNKYKGKSLEQFLCERRLTGKCPIDRNTLNGSHRCEESIIQFANRLYPGFPQTRSLSEICANRHSGIWLVPNSRAEAYVNEYHPVVLRDKSNVKTVSSPVVLNFGKSKGRTYGDVLIYPVKDVRGWLADSKKTLKDQTRSKFYVAITRARHSVGIVIPDKDMDQLRSRYQIWELGYVQQKLIP